MIRKLESYGAHYIEPDYKDSKDENKENE